MSRFKAAKWKRFWFLIKDMVLYTYKASEDVAALESLPLLGYKVTTSKEPIKGYPAAMIIELSHPGRSTIYFFTESSDAHKRQVHLLLCIVSLSLTILSLFLFHASYDHRNMIETVLHLTRMHGIP